MNFEHNMFNFMQAKVAVRVVRPASIQFERSVQSSSFGTGYYFTHQNPPNFL